MKGLKDVQNVKCFAGLLETNFLKKTAKDVYQSNCCMMRFEIDYLTTTRFIVKKTEQRKFLKKIKEKRICISN